MKLKLIALLTLITAFAPASKNAPLEVTVTGIKEIRGSVRVAIYDSADTFRKIPHLTLVLPVESDTLSFTVDELSIGNFAVMLYQDIDDNGKLKTNLVGMPREPWSGSFNGRIPIGPPKWKHVVFAHEKAVTSLTIQLH